LSQNIARSSLVPVSRRRAAGSLRLFPSVRPAHITDLNDHAPRPTVYLKLSYDMRDEKIPGDWRRRSLPGVLWQLWRSPPETLEVFEPLWIHYLPLWVAAVVTFRVSTRGQQARVVFFAIENNEPVSETMPGPRMLRPVALAITSALLRLGLNRWVDRIAFGTDDAEELYGTFLSGSISTTVIYDLLAPRELGVFTRPAHSAVFVGRLDERKGVRELMRAWEWIEDGLPQATLEIIGDGPLETEVTDWALALPSSRTYRGALPRHEVLEAVMHAAVSISPSQRVGRWREQVGQPIIEALSSGCTIVTTDETGLAAWLARHGHHVIAVAETNSQLPARIMAAMKEPLPPTAVLAALPMVDGRIEADRWLHRSEPVGDAPNTFS